MALTKLTTDLENIQKLSDTPNTTEGLTADELKALWDKAGTDIQDYINDTLTSEIDALITATKLAINPIGTILMNITNSNPSTYIGGTWTAWGSGRVPVGVDGTQAGFDTVEETGGANTVTLDTTMIPAHNHTLAQVGQGSTVGYGISTNPQASSTVGWLDGYVSSAGGGLAHNNLQPYITCYFFKRTA